jgi:uncharacterized protein YdhG (YjbR/CyaY superfamily)
MAAPKSTPAKKATTKASKIFTDEEKGAMKERAKELKAAASKAEAEADLHTKIAEMTETDRLIAERIHAIVMAAAPDLAPKTWYGMPAYYKDGEAVCFFQPAAKFKARYATFGFNPGANLDDGAMWPVAFAVTKLTKADEAKIADLVKKAVS